MLLDHGQPPGKPPPFWRLGIFGETRSGRGGAGSPWKMPSRP